MVRPIRYTVILGILLLTTGLGIAAAPIPLSERLSGMENMQANFSQTTKDDQDVLLQQSEGKVWVSRGNRFRIETSKPFTQVIVSDGKNLWTYDQDLEQVVVRPLEENFKQMPILLFGNPDQSVLEDYTVTDLETPEDKNSAIVDQYVLEPRNPSSLFETLTLSFSAEGPRALKLRDSLSQTTSIEFSKVDVTSKIDAARYEFKLPDGVDLIDDR